MLLNQLLTPELEGESMDTTTAVAAMPLATMSPHCHVPAEHLCKDYLDHYVGAKKCHEHNVTSLQYK